MLVVLFIVSGFTNAAANNADNAATNQQRVDFLNSIGINVLKSCEEQKEIQIPVTFSNTYEQYNNLQKDSDFNLELYKGKSAMWYSYKLVNSDEYAHLIVLNGKVIGGDISSVSFENGSMKPLNYYETNKIR